MHKNTITTSVFCCSVTHRDLNRGGEEPGYFPKIGSACARRPTLKIPIHLCCKCHYVLGLKIILRNHAPTVPNFSLWF